MNKLFLLILIGLLAFSGKTNAQNVIELWPDGVPNSIDTGLEEKTREKDGVITHVFDVSKPTLTVYKAQTNQNKKTPAVIICPGGGYVNLSILKEGYNVAEFLAANGITGIVLKYRLPNDDTQKNKTIAPLQDAREAMKKVRQMADEWNIDADKVGIMGFSAGGHLAATASTHFDTSDYSLDEIRPDFSVLIYPVASMKPGVTHMGSHDNLLGESPSKALEIEFSNELQIDENTPPTFMVHSFDDRSVPIQNSLRYIERLMEYDIECETHFYKTGGHGYGMLPGHTDTWPRLLVNWINTL
ncbi:MAG: alpha/beta hydrolase [Prolixibacteraceae bacterium]|jgi:acetyl esterase/lipase|nr:alpha/beta hydrolase [Prolixibacteraceae bacterium]